MEFEPIFFLKLKYFFSFVLFKENFSLSCVDFKILLFSLHTYFHYKLIFFFLFCACKSLESNSTAYFRVVFTVSLQRYWKWLICVLIFWHIVAVIHISISVEFRHVVFHFISVQHFHIRIPLLQRCWIKSYGIWVWFGWHALDWTVAKRLGRVDRSWSLMRCVQTDKAILLGICMKCN